MAYVLDTNAISDILARNEIVKRRLEMALLGGYAVRLNAMSFYEVRRGLQYAGATDKLGWLDEFCTRFGIVFPDDKGILDIAATLYSKMKASGTLINDADILIASMAIHGRHTLVTDDSDFDRIEGLDKEDWR